MVKERADEFGRMEDALVESMRRFRDLFEQSPIGVGIHDTAGELLIVNKFYLKIFGLDSFSEIAHQNLFTHLKLSAREIERIRSGHVVQREVKYNFDKVDFATRRQGIGYNLFIISPLFREKDIIGYMVQVQDVTQRKKVEEAQRLAELGRLVSDMAHEVNTPLTIIAGRTELALKRGVGDRGVKKTLGIISKQCSLAVDIIQRLLNYSRIGMVKKAAVDIKETLGLIVDIFQQHFLRLNIVLKKDIKDDIPSVIGDEKQLQEVFMNIIRNSADAMPEGGTITVSVSREKSFLRIDIKDTGQGMPKKVLDRIFDPFFTTKEKGPGLGLAVCHRIIQKHNGDLVYKSRIGKGTTATVLLPVRHRRAR